MDKILKLALLLFPIQLYSQSNTIKTDTIRFIPNWRKEITNTIVIGANYQGGDTSTPTKVNRWYGEIGFHKTSMNISRHGPSVLTYGISTLFSFDKEKIVGFRAGIWTSYLLAIGIHATYYTNFSQGNLKITPEFGFGLGGLKLAVGINIPTFRNKDFNALRYADVQITMNYLIKIKKIKETRL